MCVCHLKLLHILLTPKRRLNKLYTQFLPRKQCFFCFKNIQIFNVATKKDLDQAEVFRSEMEIKHKLAAFAANNSPISSLMNCERPD